MSWELEAKRTSATDLIKCAGRRGRIEVNVSAGRNSPPCSPLRCNTSSGAPLSPQPITNREFLMGARNILCQ